ncbi:MAG: queuosine salvage family protein, partial [Halobacteriaceae archaeon]
DHETMFDFCVLTSALNFSYRDFETGEVYTYTDDDGTWRGAFAMMRAFTKALNNDIPITDGQYLRSITVDETRKLFESQSDDDLSIPLLQERHAILVSMGETLTRRLNGHFHELIPDIEQSYPLFSRTVDEGEALGLVDALVHLFPLAFDDTRQLRGERIHFDKKAQLAAAMIHGRFQKMPMYVLDGISELTLFADYVIPAILRSENLLSYEEGLADDVDGGRPIAENSQREIEIRAATVVIGDALLETMNETRSRPVTIPQLDYCIWEYGRSQEIPYHITRTTSY